MHKKKTIAAALALCLALGLAGCKADRGAELISGIEARDASRLCTVRMESDVRLPDGETSYSSVASWDDGNGVRHMYGARSEVTANGSTSVTESEAWSDTGRAYVNTGSGWMEMEPGIGADRPAALDLDAAFSLIGRLGTLSDKKDLALSGGSGGTEDISFQARFSDVKKLAGSAAEGIGLDAVTVTCRFGSGGRLEGVSAEAGSPDGGGYFRVAAEISAWNADIVDGTIPEDVTGDSGNDPEIVIGPAGQGSLNAYASEYSVPDGFGSAALTEIAETIASNARFDKVSAGSMDGFDEIQYHTHGAVGNGYWTAVLSVEEYPDADKAQVRHAELQAFNDAWYGAGTADGSWASWEELDPDDAHAEALRMDGGTRVVLVQVEALSAGEMDPGALSAIAAQLAEGAGLGAER